MDKATMASSGRELSELRGWNLFAVAAAFALVCGLVEGCLYLLLQSLSDIDWAHGGPMHVEKEILYISPLVDLGLFWLAALGLTCARIFPIARRAQFSYGALAFLVFLDWIGLGHWLRWYSLVILAAGLAVAFSRLAAKHHPVWLTTLRRSLPALLGLTLSLLLATEGLNAYREFRAGRSLPPVASGSPNVLLVVLDTVRADHVSAYGYSRATTPNLEQIARHGVLFEQAFSTSSWTLPAHASLLTGHEAHEHGAEIARYDGRFPTIEGEFLRRGYRTGAFSANQFFFTRRNGFGVGFLHFQDIFGSNLDRFARTYYGRVLCERVVPRLGYKNIVGRKSAAEVNQELLGWVDQDRKRPFFAVLNYFDAHDPYRPPQPFRGRFSKLPDPGGILNELASRSTLKDPRQVQGEMDAYDGAIAYMDDQLGSLFHALDERGLLQNTCILVLSDHGEYFGEHGLYAHPSGLYRMAIQVPLIFYWKGHLPEGLRLPGPPVSLRDVAATLMELIPARNAFVFPGQSLAPLWSGKAPSGGYDHPLLRRIRAVWYNPLTDFLHPDKPDSTYVSIALITPQWHFIYSQFGGLALYDWNHDPAETNNLAWTPQGRVEVRTLFEEARQRGAVRAR